MRRAPAALAVAVAALGACSAWQTEGDYMFLRNAGADMPVWVRGNTGSGVLIVWLTSGPGDPIAVMRGRGTDRLEASYGVVYWDQRGCGSAQGNPSPATFTMDQFVEDTDKVVELVRQRYQPRQIFLIGHSWGGTLGTAYLLDPVRQAKIAGFIDLDGNHDVPAVYPLKVAWLRGYAEERIAAGTDVAHWTAVGDWCAQDPPLSRANLATLEAYREPTNATFYNPDTDFNVGFDVLFLSGESAPAYLFVNADYVEEALYPNDDVLREMSYTARMPQITLPFAALWGEHDGVVPLAAGTAAFDAVGTPAAAKRMDVFPGSAHFPFMEEPDAFAAAVESFVDSIAPP
jgi:pimeloyl-ACP methyl ester carboxylesterase